MILRFKNRRGAITLRFYFFTYSASIFLDYKEKGEEE